MSKMEMTVKDRAELLFVIKNLKVGKKEKWADGTDFVASDALANDKVLVRMVEPRNKSRFVGADDVKSMLKVMRSKDCERGIIVGKRFTEAAVEEMNLCNIQQVSEEYMPPLASENVVLAINDNINSLCKTKCGMVPFNESRCKDRLKENPCRVKSISDDALFHYERGWIDLLKNDLRQLLLMNRPQRIEHTSRGVC